MTVTDKGIEKIVKPPKRCQHNECRKKLSLIKIQCKCGLYFCDLHRYHTEHECTFNYKEYIDKEKLTNDLRCVNDKVDKL